MPKLEGILNYNPDTGVDDDTPIRRLLIELLHNKDKLWADELRHVEKLGKLIRRFTVYEKQQILDIHGRVF